MNYSTLFTSKQPKKWTGKSFGLSSTFDKYIDVQVSSFPCSVELWQRWCEFGFLKLVRRTTSIQLLNSTSFILTSKISCTKNKFLLFCVLFWASYVGPNVDSYVKLDTSRHPGFLCFNAASWLLALCISKPSRQTSKWWRSMSIIKHCSVLSCHCFIKTDTRFF